MNIEHLKPLLFPNDPVILIIKAKQYNYYWQFKEVNRKIKK